MTILIVIIPMAVNAVNWGDKVYGNSNTNDGNWTGHYLSGYDSTSDRSEHMKSYWDLWNNHVSGGKEDGCSPNDIAASSHNSIAFTPSETSLYKVKFHFDLYGTMSNYNDESYIKVAIKIQYYYNYYWIDLPNTAANYQYSQTSTIDQDHTYTTPTSVTYYSGTYYRAVYGFEISIGNSHCNPEGSANFYYGQPTYKEVILDYWQFVPPN